MVEEVEGLAWEAEFPTHVTTTMLRDIYKNNAQTLGRTLRFYEVRNPKGEIILAAGVALWDFTRPLELWMMLAKPFTSSLRESLLLTREGLRLPISQYGRLIAEVAQTNSQELNFVKKLGFRPTGLPSLRPNGADCVQFEVTL